MFLGTCSLLLQVAASWITNCPPLVGVVIVLRCSVLGTEVTAGLGQGPPISVLWALKGDEMGCVAESSRNLSQSKEDRHKMRTRMVGSDSALNYYVGQVRSQWFWTEGSKCLYCSDVSLAPYLPLKSISTSHVNRFSYFLGLFFQVFSFHRPFPFSSFFCMETWNSSPSSPQATSTFVLHTPKLISYIKTESCLGMPSADVGCCFTQWLCEHVS